LGAVIGYDDKFLFILLINKKRKGNEYIIKGNNKDSKEERQTTKIKGDVRATI
jgi:hypothetical protein